MTSPVKVNFKIYQGSTFKEILRWESSTKVYKPITSISQNAPCQITAVGHGVPTGWRIKITNVKGMKEINSSDTYHTATADDVDTISINDLNTVDYSAYTSGGILEYNEPVDLSGVTARMQLREKIDSTDFIHELTTENGGITIDQGLKTITLNITATDTAAFTFTTAVYSLELVSGSEVTPFINGNISLVKEVTR
jgi:hypothetical protein